MKKICLITPGHISSNPRLVKEAMALSGAGYKVHLVFTQYLNYLKQEDFKILKNFPEWSYSCLDWTDMGRAQKIRRYVSGLVQKVANTLFKRFPIAGIEKLAINRHYFWQLKEAIKANANLYIAHNLGALPVAKAAAEINHTKSGFDAEDFHRHESSDDVQDPAVLLNKYIEEKHIPGTDHLTAASPLIAEEYGRLFPGVQMQSILNVFPKQEINNQVANRGPIKLFWFSQRIGKGRGIEEVIAALPSTDEPVEVHLLGDLGMEDKQYFLTLIAKNNLDERNFYFYPPISPDEVIPFASKFDIGLATETGVPLNRDICLTNKIFSYLQAGLAVLASDTRAQVDLLVRYPAIGLIYDKRNPDSLAKALNFYMTNRSELEKAKASAMRLSENELNWEKEQVAYLGLISAVLKK